MTGRRGERILRTVRIKRYLRAAIVVLTGWLGGCTDFARLEAEKAESLISWREAAVETPTGAVATAVYIKQRCAVMLQGVDRVEIVGSGGDRRLRLMAGDMPATDVAGGAAAAVSDEGYWLTAAHCVDEGPVVLLLTDEAGGVEAAPARVVWTGNAGEPGGDLALLYVPGSRGRPVFAMADRAPERGAVLCRGSGLGSTALAAGEVTSVGGATDGSVAWFEHSAPLGPGDSGGPAMLPDGRLGGINVQATPRGGRYRSTAVWMNPVKLRRLIDEDLRRTP